MDYPSLQDLASESLPLKTSSPTIEQSDMSNGINTVKTDSEPESTTASSMTLLSSETFGSSTSDTRISTLEKWISSLGVSPVSLSLSLARTSAQRTKEICGQQPSNVLASYDRSSACWRTSQISLLTNTLDEYSETWPKSGMIVNGTLYQRLSLVRPTSGKESGYWPSPVTYDATPGGPNNHYHGLGHMAKTGMWPTPTSGRADQGISPSQLKRNSFNLAQTVELKEKMWPTPRVGDVSGGDRSKWVAAGKWQEGLREAVGGQLNPTWVEWLMGWPIGWTDLRLSEMGGFRKWLNEFCR